MPAFRSLWPALLLSTACLSSTPQVIVGSGTTLTVAPSEPVLAPGASLQLQIYETTEGVSKSATGVTWASSDTSVATVSSTGLVQGLAVGTTLMTATTGELSGVAVVTVQLSPSVGSASLTLAPDAPTIPLGASQQLLAFQTSGGSMEPVTDAAWMSTNPSVATVSASGLVRSLSTGTTLVVATKLGLSAVATVTVTPTAITSIELSLDHDSACILSQVTARAVARFSDGTSLDITHYSSWVTSDPGIASFAGLYSAATFNAVTDGTVTLAAAYQGAFGTTTLTVLPLKPSSTRITAMQNLSALPVGLATHLQLTATCADDSPVDLTDEATWSATPDTTGFTLSAAGYLAPRATGTGTAQAQFGEATYTKVITVVPAATNTVSVSPNRTITVGQNTTMTANVSRTDNSTYAGTNLVTWTTSNAGVATVDAAGNVHGVGVGVALITAVLDGKSGAATVTVNAAPVTSAVTVSPDRSVAAGKDTTVTATATRTDGSQFDATSTATWVSSNLGVATVDSTGKVHGVATGTATVTATVDGKSGSATITVTPATVVSIGLKSPMTHINGGAINLPLGFTVQVSLLIVYSDGSTQDVTEAAVWTSTDTTLVSVTSGDIVNGVPSWGVVSGVATGGFPQVRARYQNNTYTTGDIEVESPQTSISISPASATLARGVQRQFHVQGPFDLTTYFTWTSSNPSVASVTNDAEPGGCSLRWGCVTTEAAGTTNICATRDDLSACATVTVSP